MLISTYHHDRFYCVADIPQGYSITLESKMDTRRRTAPCAFFRVRAIATEELTGRCVVGVIFAVPVSKSFQGIFKQIHLYFCSSIKSISKHFKARQTFDGLDLAPPPDNLVEAIRRRTKADKQARLDSPITPPTDTTNATTHTSHLRAIV